MNCRLCIFQHKNGCIAQRYSKLITCAIWISYIYSRGTVFAPSSIWTLEGKKTCCMGNRVSPLLIDPYMTMWIWSALGQFASIFSEQSNNRSSFFASRYPVSSRSHKPVRRSIFFLGTIFASIYNSSIYIYSPPFVSLFLNYINFTEILPCKGLIIVHI